MDTDRTLAFKISSGLKSLIGKELITDEYIAIFELVKNSFDARADQVQLIFENIYSTNSRIIIIDNGKGMDLKDIKNKWLFVAYSAKKDGTEDDDIGESNDYRHKITSKRFFAGAKGVGRFSCDRLGSKLNMITVKKTASPKIENVVVDWNKFEQDTKQEFIKIDIDHKVLDKHPYKIKHGTILEITNLRDSWDREKLLRLKRSLEKLINPNTQSNNFAIEIIAKDEEKADKNAKKDTDIVNGVIKNTVFETLNLKTTQIVCKISDDGEQIVTTLSDRGKLIYEVTEKNNFLISNISIHLFYLNQIAKLNFTKIMGIRPVRYGSVFLYKNGFRIYPFGEEGEDTLKLDRRKIQGQRRYLGTRELIGRIEILGENEDFIETTSRDGGLIRNTSYEELVSFFYEKALRRLERYVVNIIKWGEPFKIDSNDEEFQDALNPEDVKENIIKTISSLTSSKDIIKVEYDKDFLNIIEERQENSVTNVFNSLKLNALTKTKDPELQEEIKKIGGHLKELLIEKQEIENDYDQKAIELKHVNTELEHTRNQNLFLKSISTVETKEIVSMQHHINHSTNTIKRNLDYLTEAIERNADKSELMEYIRKISLENSKVSTMSKFVTKANFNMKAQQITADIVEFINEYIENVYKEYKHLIINKQMLHVEIENPHNSSFILKFRPLEIIVIIDNLLTNSYKAKAKSVVFTWGKTESNSIELSIKDDGIGIPDKNLENIFDFGFTTTDGSGLGLYHIKSIVEEMKGQIKVNTINKGVEFIWRINR
ncbi:ATP-binding protein [Brevibacillus parabrevis]|uniref:ATP-binding protein n=1 Tax=Brevibacillus parabrevis TaxID=54914 RepID=UPI001C220389|nr:ATP-binding protein [Brevibacillus parabrevis]MBU8716086.1 ATP-binding protein [Brevibacillus parabrevis]